nr:T cell receptor beta B6-73 [Mus musculus]
CASSQDRGLSNERLFFGHGTKLSVLGLRLSYASHHSSLTSQCRSECGTSEDLR